MKKIAKVMFTSLFLLAFSIQVNALCINCGCQKAYNTCVSNNGTGACEDCGEEYCKGNRKACHGTGIKIKL